MSIQESSVYIDIKRAGYKIGEDILRDIRMSIGRGQTILLVGPSGSGKTTLILAITGVLNNLLEGYVEGDVNIFGVNPIDPDGFISVPETIGVVLQDPDKQLSMSTPYDEVAFTLQNLGYDIESIEKLTYEILRLMGLENKILYDSLLLSGGEKKRLCIASSIVHKPRLLILDEPTANLDPWGVKDLLKYIYLLKERGYTLLIIEHKAKYFLRISDEIILLKDGSIAGKFYPHENRFRDIQNFLSRHGVDASFTVSKYHGGSGGNKDIHLKIENLWFRYPRSNVDVLRDVNIRVGLGDVIAFIGPNGSGKTTLLKLIAGFYKPQNGVIKLVQNGVEEVIKGPGDKIIYIPQEPDYMFIYSTVREELFKTGSIDKVRSLLNESPWLRPLLDKSPYDLSHGQRRWLAYYIARLYEPEVYLFDEPSAGLDLDLLKSFMDNILNLSREGKTVLMATHDPRILSMGIDRAFLFVDGKVIEKDPYEALNEMEDLFRGGVDES